MRSCATSRQVCTSNASDRYTCKRMRCRCGHSPAPVTPGHGQQRRHGLLLLLLGGLNGAPSPLHQPLHLALSHCRQEHNLAPRSVARSRGFELEHRGEAYCFSQQQRWPKPRRHKRMIITGVAQWPVRLTSEQAAQATGAW